MKTLPALRSLLPLLALTLVGCAAAGPTVPAAPGPTPPPGAAPTASAAAAAASPETTDATLTLWLDPRFTPDAAAGLGAILDRWRSDHPGVTLAIAVRPVRGATAASAFLDALQRVAPQRLPDVALVPLDLVPTLRRSGLATALGTGQASDRAAEAFPFATRLATAEDGTVWAVPLAVDAAFIVGRGAPLATWDDLAPSEWIAAPAPTSQPATLALALALFAAADGRLDELAAPDDAALTVAFGRLEAARARDQVRVVADALPLGPLRAASAGRARAALVTAGGYVKRALSRADGGATELLGDGNPTAWSALPGIDRAAPPIAWGWGLVLPRADSPRRDLALELAERITRPADAAWVVDAGGLPAYPDAFAATLAPDGSQAALAALGDFVSVQLMAASSLAAPESAWERWRSAVETTYSGAGAAAAIGAWTQIP